MTSLLDQRCGRLATTLRYVGAVLLLLGLPQRLIGSEYLATADFRDVEPVVQAYAAQYGAENVLLVVDIDNTLLAMNLDLGSDQWFEWQVYLLEHEPTSPHLVASTFEGLLEVQGLLFTLGRMHPPQPEQPVIVGRLQGMGVKTLVLTSRGDEYREATERELKRNGYDFARSALAVREPRQGRYSPYDLAQPLDAGLSPAEVQRFGLKAAKPVSYEHGIMMVSGQHKGAMLLTMLHRATRDVRAVVFVDDHGRHVGRVFAALTGRDCEVTVIHYFHEDTRVARFQYSDKREVVSRWQRLRRTLEEVFE